MNLLPEEAFRLCSEVEHMVKDEVNSQVRTIICPPLIYINALKRMLDPEGPVSIGAQNCHFETKGAFTGEVSPIMLKELGVEYVIAGHSERRTLFGEDDDLVRRKVDAILENGMTPIFCCGEPLEIRDSGEYLAFVSDQIQKDLMHLSDEQLKQTLIAYEPIWAIGTGRTASPEQAQEVHAFIRSMIATERGDDVSSNISILYGGSCNAENASELFSCADVDGGLIGGASLKSRSFVDIAKSF